MTTKDHILLFFPPRTVWLELQYQPVREVEIFVVHDLISNAFRKPVLEGRGLGNGGLIKCFRLAPTIPDVNFASLHLCYKYKTTKKYIPFVKKTKCLSAGESYLSFCP